MSPDMVANFGKEDFAPVAAAFKVLLDCSDALTASLSYTSRRVGKPESLRCRAEGSI